LPSLYSEWRVALDRAKQDGLGSNPLKTGVTSLLLAGIIRVLFPCALPVYMDIDVVALDHDPLDSKL
jgi:hypothetical protein